MKKRVLKALVGLFIAISAVYIWQLIGKPHSFLTSTLFLIPPALAVASGLLAMRTYGLSSASGRMIVWLTAGLGCWFMGEFIFYLLQFVVHSDPFPSIADAFYIAAYPLILIGLIQQIREYGFGWQGVNKLSVSMAGLLALALAFIVSYFGIFLAYDTAQPLLNNLVAMGYGVGDLILLVPVFFILKLASDFRGGKLYGAWMMIFVALLCIMVGDILFAIYSEQYEALQPAYLLIDLAWTAGYLLFAYSLFYTSITIKQLQATLRKKQIKAGKS